MTINKNTDLEFSLQKGTEKGGVYTNFYTEDKGSASIRIRLSSNEYYLDLTKTDLKPVLFLFHEDGSIFEIKDFINVMPDKGLIQYNLSDNVIAHAGKVKAKLFLRNVEQSVHVANFTFDIKDSGIEGAVAKEISVNLVDDAVRRIIEENPDNFKGKDADPEEVKTLLEPYAESIAKQEFEKLSTAKQVDSEVISARGNKESLNTRLTGIQSEIGVSVTDYGASVDTSWTDNRNAIQSAIDEVYKNGGGVVSFPPGIYTVKGLLLKDNVTLSGEGVTLKHPDGLAPDIVKSYTFDIKGTANEDLKSLNVSDSSQIKVGSIIGIRGAGGIHESQKTTLINTITKNQTVGIKLADITGFLNNGYLLIENEIIGFTGLTNNELTGVTRGVFGTTQTDHLANVEIGLVLRKYSEVIDIEGNTLLLDETIPLKVANTDITVGSVNPQIKNIRFDGNRLTGGAPSEVHPIKFELTRFGLISNVTVQNGEAGIMARHGNHDLLVDNPTFIDCSVPEKTFGSGGWLFRANKRCKYQNVTAIGQMWTGIYFDDRTSKGIEWDGENIDCVIDGMFAKLDRLSDNLGFVIVGSNRSSARNIKISGPRTGFSITSNSQGVGYPKYNATGNIFESIQISNVYQPSIIKAQKTKFINVTYEDATTSYRRFLDSSGDTMYINSGGDLPKTTYEDGTYNSPSYSFTKDPTTGFYRITEGQIQFVSKGVATVRMIATGMMLAEGKDLSVGAGTGSKIGTSPAQKLGFYGNTPITQPTKIGTIASSATQEDIANQLNLVIVALRNLGLIGN